MGSVVISRKMPDGEIGFGVFLIDVFCLGVKTAFFSVRPRNEYERFIGRISEKEALQPEEPACAVKLIRSAEAYARGLGLDPILIMPLPEEFLRILILRSVPGILRLAKTANLFMWPAPMKQRLIPEGSWIFSTKKLGPDGFHYVLPVGS